MVAWGWWAGGVGEEGCPVYGGLQGRWGGDLPRLPVKAGVLTSVQDTYSTEIESDEHKL